MRTCNFFRTVLFLFSVPLFAESIEMPQMPKMPDISSMPEISMPKMDSNFYRPSIPSQNPGKKNTKEEKKLSETAPASTELLLSDGTTTEDIITSLLSDSSTLTANDISTLYDSGLFTDISSLGTGSLTSYSQSSTTNLLLQQILTNLNNMKAEQKVFSVAEQTALTNTQEDLQTFKKRSPEILRFKINGYNIADSLTKVFFSEPETDGSFLLTADRKYYADNKTRTETFYILFKTVKNSGSTISYEVQPSIVQDYKNENSFVYKFSEQKNLTADKTGNLVVLHTSGPLNIDMLLNIDK